MKKVKKSSASPVGLDNYQTINPNNKWQQFRDNDPASLDEVKVQIIRDQGGLCAYCEIDTCISVHGVGLDDFRIDHFHPKSPPMAHNHGLDWFNLLGVCHGGSQASVAIPNRCTSPDHSCDVPKGNYNLLGLILDPVNDVPAYPGLFQYIEQGIDAGKIAVDTSNCPTHLQIKAKNSIEKLRLDAPRLNRLRKVVIDELREDISNSINAGQSLDEVLDNLAVGFFTPAANGHWQPFFSCIRWYLGVAAEKQLQAINYQG